MQILFNATAKNVFAAVLILFAFVSVFAQKEEKEQRDAAKKANQAAKVFEQAMSKSDKSIPHELLERAEAVAIFPGMLKAAFIIGGRGGEGVISRRTSKGWSAPAFFKLGGGSFGLQIGATKADLVLLIMNEGGLKGLLEDKFEFGGEAGAVAGPIGREVSAETNATLDAAILSYSRSKGAFLGAALTGAVLSADNDKNRALYGKTAKDFLLAGTDVTNAIPDSVRTLPQTLTKFSNRKSGEKNTSQSSRARVAGGATTISPSGSDIYSVTRSPRQRDAAMDSGAMTGEDAVRRSRAKLARQVRTELLSLPDYGTFDWLEFEITESDTVILRGQVTRPALKKYAEDAAADVEGVTNVRNDVEILPESSEDENLREEIYRAVFSGQLSRSATAAANSIHIVVKNGSVTVKGLVDSEADKNFASVQANSVEGVADVRNELLIDAP